MDFTNNPWRISPLQIWNVWRKFVRTVLYKLRKREAATAVQPTRLQTGASGIHQGRNKVELYRLYWQSALYRSHRKENGNHRLVGRAMPSKFCKEKYSVHVIEFEYIFCKLLLCLWALAFYISFYFRWIVELMRTGSRFYIKSWRTVYISKNQKPVKLKIPDHQYCCSADAIVKFH